MLSFNIEDFHNVTRSDTPLFIHVFNALSWVFIGESWLLKLVENAKLDVQSKQVFFFVTNLITFSFYSNKMSNYKRDLSENLKKSRTAGFLSSFPVAQTVGGPQTPLNQCTSFKHIHNFFFSIYIRGIWLA